MNQISDQKASKWAKTGYVVEKIALNSEYQVCETCFPFPSTTLQYPTA